MKKSSILLNSLFLLAFVLLANIVLAQALPGPSDATTAPPATASAVGEVLCSGTPISFTGPLDVNNTAFAKYHWYKLDASGNNQPTSTTSQIYTETPTAPGYYNYVLVTENANGCTSPASNVYQVFVLPQLSATVTTPNNSICIGVGSTTLTASTNSPAGYTYNYQWTQNGVNIPGATTSTYNVTGQSVGSSVTFGVKMTYVLNPACVGSATTTIIMTPLPTKPLIIAN